MRYVPVIIGMAVGLAVAGLLFKPLFRDIEGFMDCLKTENRVSGFNPKMGTTFQDGVGVTKVVVWLACVGGSATGAWYALVRWVF
jgi:hypothetical protein